MQVVERDETVVLGIEVVAPFGELATALPRAWREMFARRGELPVTEAFAEASCYLGDGRYRETVGVIVPLTGPVSAPDGLTPAILPAGRYLHHRHEGPVEEIAAGFQAIYDRAAADGLRLGHLKLDVGYTAEGAETAHDLYIDVLP